MEDTTVVYGVDDAGDLVVLERTADEVLSAELFMKTPVVHVDIGPDVREVDVPRDPGKLLESFSLHPRNAHFAADGACLFSPDGSTLVSCLVNARTYRVPQGVRSIGPHAFECCTALEHVTFPDTLREIGEDAFFSCVQLHSADLPDGIRSVGAHAFLCTGLSEFRIPASLEHMGGAAVYSVGKLAYAIDGERDVDFQISVDEGNGRFSIRDGFLCQDEGSEVCALLCLVDQAEVVVPEGVTHLGELALLGIENIRKLVLPASLRSCDESAFVLSGRLSEIEVHLDSGATVTLLPSNTMPSRFMYSVAAENRFDLAKLVHECDESMLLAYPTGYRVGRIIARLQNGVMLGDHVREQMRHVLERDMGEAVRLCAAGDDVEGLTTLCEVGAITGENITRAVDVANAAGGVRAAGFLLDKSRTLRAAALSGLEL